MTWKSDISFPKSSVKTSGLVIVRNQLQTKCISIKFCRLPDLSSIPIQSPYHHSRYLARRQIWPCHFWHKSAIGHRSLSADRVNSLAWSSQSSPIFSLMSCPSCSRPLQTLLTILCPLNHCIFFMWNSIFNSFPPPATWETSSRP